MSEERIQVLFVDLNRLEKVLFEVLLDVDQVTLDIAGLGLQVLECVAQRIHSLNFLPRNSYSTALEEGIALFHRTQLHVHLNFSSTHFIQGLHCAANILQILTHSATITTSVRAICLEHLTLIGLASFLL